MKFLRNFFCSKAAVFAVSILVLILAIVISLCVGAVMYSPAELLKMPDILRYIRFPRVMAAVFAGAGLAGLIGFLGLIVPHGARLVVSDEIKKLFPLSVLWGSLLLLVCDTVARTVFSPFELSVGIVISIIGTPIFIKMLLKRKVG